MEQNEGCKEVGGSQEEGSTPTPESRYCVLFIFEFPSLNRARVRTEWVHNNYHMGLNCQDKLLFVWACLMHLDSRGFSS